MPVPEMNSKDVTNLYVDAIEGIEVREDEPTNPNTLMWLEIEPEPTP